jgi:hypothetical protein
VDDDPGRSPVRDLALAEMDTRSNLEADHPHGDRSIGCEPNGLGGFVEHSEQPVTRHVDLMTASVLQDAAEDRELLQEETLPPLVAELRGDPRGPDGVDEDDRPKSPLLVRSRHEVSLRPTSPDVKSLMTLATA